MGCSAMVRVNASNRFVKRGGNRFDREPLEGLRQRMSEAVQSISMADNALTFNIVQNFANLPGGIFLMVRNEMKLTMARSK